MGENEEDKVEDRGSGSRKRKGDEAKEGNAQSKRVNIGDGEEEDELEDLIPDL